MLAKLQKWGNSQGVLFPTAMLEQTELKVGDEVNISVEGQRIVIEPAARARGRYRLMDLVSKMPKDYMADEVDWGPPVGKEEW